MKQADEDCLTIDKYLNLKSFWSAGHWEVQPPLVGAKSYGLNIGV